jgi:class 3 adenylate cyclase
VHKLTDSEVGGRLGLTLPIWQCAGLHGGPAAGVLRGERSRFQLFGDTMNTASRMEYWSPRHDPCPQDTVDLLVAAGKKWVASRDEGR